MTDVIGRCYWRKKGAVHDLVQQGLPRRHQEPEVERAQAASWSISRVYGLLVAIMLGFVAPESCDMSKNLASPFHNAAEQAKCR